MTRPAVEVADILRVQGKRFLDRYRSSFDFQQLKAFRAIQNCRTAALGGHLDACPQCGYQAISYNSCRNRHCPKCQAQARERWLAARKQELLATNYFHVVFTVPHELKPLALDNPRVFYQLLFTASAATLLEVAADPNTWAPPSASSAFSTPGVRTCSRIRIFTVSSRREESRWILPVGCTRAIWFFLPVKVLSRVFRGKLVAGLKGLYRRQELRCAGPSATLADEKQFRELLRRLHRQDWVVYAKAAFGGPRQVLRYLGRYTHRGAISNHRPYPSTGSASPSAGRIMPTAAGHAR